MVDPVEVVVTGAAGFIGSHIVKRLEADGIAVQGVDLLAGDSPTLRMDVTDGALVLAVLERLRPRHVIHAAALVDDRGEPDLFQAVNVTGTQNVIDAAAAVGVERIVHISSIAAIGLDPGRHADESAPLVFDTGAPYLDTKAASEELVRRAMAERELPAVIVRPGDVYGPGCEPWVERPLRMLRRGLPLLVGGGRGLMAHCWIDNLVDGVVAALRTPGVEGRVYHLTDGVDDTTYGEYFGRLAEIAGLSMSRVSVPEATAVALGHVFEATGRLTTLTAPWTAGAARYLTRQSTYSTEAARRDLAWSPKVSLDDGLSHLEAHLREQTPSTARQ